jgi:hypothetical protein
MNIKADNSTETNGSTRELLSFINRWLFWPVLVVVLLEFASLEDRAIINLLGHTVMQLRYGSSANFVFAAMLMPLLTLAVALFACWKTNQVVSKLTDDPLIPRMIVYSGLIVVGLAFFTMDLIF